MHFVSTMYTKSVFKMGWKLYYSEFTKIEKESLQTTRSVFSVPPLIIKKKKKALKIFSLEVKQAYP